MRLYDKNRDLSQPLERVELRVDAPDEGRLDAFLARHLPWRSRTGVKQLIAEGKALLNGELRKPSAKVKAGDRVTVEVVRETSGSAAEPAPPEVRFLYEDEWIWALDKPSGVVVHPVGSYQRGTLLQELHRRYGPRAKLIHRIDQHTSGVLLVAKNDASRRAFSALLEESGVEKDYDALLLGVLGDDERWVDAPIGPVEESRILMAVDVSNGKSARSRFQVVERFPFATHASVRIFTGRTHQIRVHAAHLGHPLLADHLYGDGLPVGDPPVLEHFALHARRIGFAHPFRGDSVRIEAPLPETFRAAIGALRAPSP